jgi:hypothetical protein
MNYDIGSDEGIAEQAILENCNHEEIGIIKASQRRYDLSCLTVLVGLFLSTPGEAAGPWRAHVIDKETGKPIEGAAVFVRWEKRYRSFIGEMGGNEYYDSEEAVTNADAGLVIGARQTCRLNPLNEIYRPNFFSKSGYGRWRFRDFDRWWKGGLFEVRRPHKS